ncbi:Stc1 domain-containing protein [Aspergillus minisclerotigenes]|uniref:Stc1 domain-containing protein n=1 Tax=Aspergillus minisclerotigenes TaxID=656917 RepID=A0A5N6JID9_9EURO|nr:Stc1 domain-containing protein [Aspergillus minisclerotigenes]
MGDRVKNAYAGGYSDAIKRQLERVVIPDRVKCMTCKKIRMQSAYSKRQLDVLRNAIVVQGGRALTGPGLAKCRECVGGQTVELRCVICDETKGLEEFAKNQRHDRDHARCLGCVQNHTETEPVFEEQKLLAESEMSTAQDTTTSSQADDGYAYSTTYGEDEEDDDDYSIGGGVWVEPECPQGNPPTKSKEREYTGYDQQGIPHRLSTPTTTPKSVHSGWASWGIEASSVQANTPRAGKPSPSAQKKTSNFAKIPKMRVERSDLRTTRTPAPAREHLAYEKGDHVDIEDFL